LNEIGIQPVERNDLNSASIAGFSGAVPDQTQLFIREDEYEQASAIITAFIENNSYSSQAKNNLFFIKVS